MHMTKVSGHNGDSAFFMQSNADSLRMSNSQEWWHIFGLRTNQCIKGLRFWQKQLFHQKYGILLVPATSLPKMKRFLLPIIVCGSSLKVCEGYLNHNNVGKRKQSDIMLFLSSHYSVNQGFGVSSMIWSAQLAILISHCKGCAFEADLCHGIQSFIYSRGVQNYSPWANWGLALFDNAQAPVLNLITLIH